MKNEIFPVQVKLIRKKNRSDNPTLKSLLIHLMFPCKFSLGAITILISDSMKDELLNEELNIQKQNYLQSLYKLLILQVWS